MKIEWTINMKDSCAKERYSRKAFEINRKRCCAWRILKRIEFTFEYFRGKRNSMYEWKEKEEKEEEEETSGCLELAVGSNEIFKIAGEKRPSVKHRIRTTRKVKVWPLERKMEFHNCSLLWIVRVLRAPIHHRRKTPPRKLSRWKRGRALLWKRASLRNTAEESPRRR